MWARRGRWDSTRVPIFVPPNPTSVPWRAHFTSDPQTTWSSETLILRKSNRTGTEVIENALWSTSNNGCDFNHSWWQHDTTWQGWLNGPMVLCWLQVAWMLRMLKGIKYWPITVSSFSIYIVISISVRFFTFSLLLKSGVFNCIEQIERPCLTWKDK